MVQTVVTSGDLCVFRRVDDDQKLLIGRIVQFSYLTGTKRQQEYSSMYVDLTKDHSGIGAFANWFAVADNVDGFVHFSPLIDVFTQGYVSMEKYVCTLPKTNLSITQTGFKLPVNMTIIDFENWENTFTKFSEF